MYSDVELQSILLTKEENKTGFDSKQVINVTKYIHLYVHMHIKCWNNSAYSYQNLKRVGRVAKGLFYT